MLDNERKQEIAKLCLDYADSPSTVLLQHITTVELFQFMVACTLDIIEMR